MFCAALKLKRKKDATFLFSDRIKNNRLYFGYSKNNWSIFEEQNCPSTSEKSHVDSFLQIVAPWNHQYIYLLDKEIILAYGFLTHLNMKSFVVKTLSFIIRKEKKLVKNGSHAFLGLMSIRNTDVSRYLSDFTIDFY